MTNYYKDCKSYRKLPFKVTPECTKDIYRTDIVDGYVEYHSCSFARMKGSTCGPDAELFEQKVTLWQRVKLMMTY